MREKQVGASFAGWLMLLLVLGSVITIGTKLAPLYLDHGTMSNLMDKMASEDGQAGLSKRNIYAALKKRFKLNNIRNFSVEDNIEIDRTANGTELKMNYEVRIPLIHNVDLIASFSKEVELRK